MKKELPGRKIGENKSKIDTKRPGSQLELMHL